MCDMTLSQTGKRAGLIGCLVLAGLCVFYVLKSPELSAEEQYENIVQSIKDNPRQAIKDLKKLVDKNNSAAVEYLILLSIYEPQKVNTPEFEQIARQLHEKLTAQYAKIVDKEPFYKMYQHSYAEAVKDDYLKCYKDLKCLIEIGAFHFSKFFNIWDNESIYMGYVPWKIIVPCPTARQLHVTAILDVAGGGSGSETLDISNCIQYPQYSFPKDVWEYHRYIHDTLDMQKLSSSRFLHAAYQIYEDLLSYYDPDWSGEHLYSPLEPYPHALPLEAWAMESYPNYKYFSDIMNYGIGFEQAVDKLAQHYVKTFKVDERMAQSYARYAMIPDSARSYPVNKETLRYKILSGVPAAEIKTWVESKKLKGEEFAEPQTPHPADDILMVSVHRPDVLQMLLETCPNDEEKLNCLNLNTDVNAVNDFGKTALMYAAQYGFLDSVKILLAAGADINAQTNKGNFDGPDCYDNICITNGERTALMYAVQEGNLQIAEYLVEHGADINLTDSKGMTVYDYLTGAAPYLGNFRPSPAIERQYYPPEEHKNNNVTPEQAQDFLNFLKSRATPQSSQ